MSSPLGQVPRAPRALRTFLDREQEQGSVMPFFEGLESGVMRPLLLPDGSLLLGQTGRGWQAKGGR